MGRKGKLAIFGHFWPTTSEEEETGELGKNTTFNINNNQ